MSERQWTEAQQKVIDYRNCNILVSAAAGSGKTAVLVQRIIDLITKGDHPYDIDEILVVTFTKAAAKEMKERVTEAVDELIEKNPTDLHLLRQLTLIHNAQITTIDGFCMYLIKNYFNEIQLDPNYRVLDQGEASLLKADVMAQLMERKYESAEEVFLQLTDMYASRSKDDAITEMIEALYTQAMSTPWPEEWLDHAIDAYHLKHLDEVLELPIVKAELEVLKNTLTGIRPQIEANLALAMEDEAGRYMVEPARKDLERLDSLIAAPDFKTILELSQPQFATAKGKPKEPEDAAAFAERLEKNRKNYKDAINKVKERAALADPEAILYQFQTMEPYMQELVDLTKEFMHDFTALKREKNLIDFNDQEHLALSILCDSETKTATRTAKELRSIYKEVMIDEYQDSNDIQEKILSTISGNEDGIYNYFMVGDVKQSIYRFRMSRPEIFTEKYQCYTDEPSDQQRIILDRNFRSRGEVLDATNDIFRRIMHKGIGKVEYDKNAWLNFGSNNYPEFAEDHLHQVELLLADANKEDLEIGEFDHKLQLEAHMVGERILKLKKEMKVSGEKGQPERPVRNSDIVILLRGVKNTAGYFIEELGKMGIPAFVTSTEGYFSNLEVETVLNFLRVLDNPTQDIPFAAVLHSPIFGFSNEELAVMKSESKRANFYQIVWDYHLKHPENTKLENCLDYIEEKRYQVFDTPIHKLIMDLYRETGYLDYVSVLPGGDIRRANLEKLVDQAIAFERTSYKGLFRFISYIEKLKKYNVDFGSADLSSENDDVVRIMTIHKSKGLEFPVCFVSGLGQCFVNEKDKLTLHADYGIALPFVEGERRIKYPSFYRDAIRNQNKLDTLGEEIRILYVALTRAKEKLILTGAVKDGDDYIEKCLEKDGILTFQDMQKAKSFLDLTAPILLHNRVKYQCEKRGLEHLTLDAVLDHSLRLSRIEKLQSLYDAESGELPDYLLTTIYQYPYSLEQSYKNKYSVSEVKHLAMQELLEEETPVEELFQVKPTEEMEIIEPSFISGKESLINPGALRGTAMHRVMECYDFLRADYRESLEEQICEMEEKNLLLPEQSALIQRKKLQNFLNSNLAKRMHEASVRNQLYKEKAFVMGQKPAELFQGIDGISCSEEDQELILVQGIIDVFFEEEDGIVLLDYKTDSVESKEKLASLYAKQLKIYADAIEGAYGKPVKELLLYSFKFEEEIALS